MEPANGTVSGWFLTGVEQQEEHLVGIFGYGQTVGRDKLPSSLIVKGTESTNGVFWPNVTLAVKDTASGTWKEIECKPANGKPKTITIARGELKLYLLVNFDPFISLLDRFKEGQVTFENGDRVDFPLDYLRAD